LFVIHPCQPTAIAGKELDRYGEGFFEISKSRCLQSLQRSHDLELAWLQVLSSLDPTTVRRVPTDSFACSLRRT